MWARKMFLVPFFFLSGLFQGGHFFGGIIYLAALDLRPTTLNLRPTLQRHAEAGPEALLCGWSARARWRGVLF
jgi:hypothetical protein